MKFLSKTLPNFILNILSPTLYVARLLKNKLDRTQTIKNLNTIYLSWALFVSTVAIFYETIFNIPAISWSVALLAISRCNEVFIAFLRDALAKIGDEEKRSQLRSKDRVALALKSYLELIFNFALLYWIMPDSYFNPEGINSFIDGLYFSGVTITTLGYGDIQPTNYIPKLLSIYEVLCGFIIIIVSFTIYVGRKFR